MASLAVTAPSFFATATEQLQSALPRAAPSSSAPPPKELKGWVPFQGRGRGKGKGKARRLNGTRIGALHLQRQNQNLDLNLEAQGHGHGHGHGHGQPLHILPDYHPIQPPLNPVLIDVQDSREDSIVFSFGIAEQCTRHEKILRYLMSGSGANFSQLCDLMGFQACGPLMPEDRLLLGPRTQTESLLQFVGGMSASSLLSVDPSGRILFSGSHSETRDLLSILAEFNFPPPAATKVSLLVPYFDRYCFLLLLFNFILLTTSLGLYP